ncbi:PAS domain-containing protein [Actinoplanes sp. LDG1-06]|uniref:PAS domain-containing protein n=1 Tax=Paractinoplanes ovalisporus TaxID=2810368 RepID=A0ABS2AKC2_9ACTN|nr:PAS domain-containing protein [Actinoplanes ovalisporus]MBM2619684.1 PAS domain-containing protein [Actinoplanes ovalisporus]
MNPVEDAIFFESSSVGLLDSGEFADGFRSLFEQSGLCMANLDARLRVREANTDFLREVNRRPQDTYDRPFLALLHRSVRSTVERELTELVAGRRERFTERILAVQPDGTLVPAEMTAIAVADAAGQVDTVLVLVIAKPREDERPAPASVKLSLQPMDARILEGVAAGVSTVKLASLLFMSRGGVEYRVTALLRMLRAPNRPALVSKAHSIGMFNTEVWPPKVHPEYVKV